MSILSTAIGVLVTMSAPAQTATPATERPVTVDTGMVSVLNDGTIVIAWGALDEQGHIPADFEPIAAAVVLSDASRLICTDGLWTVIPTEANGPGIGDVMVDIVLTNTPERNGCARYAVLEASGLVTLTPTGKGGTSTLEVISAGGCVVFRADIVALGEYRPASPSYSSCSAECDHGTCRVDNCDGIAWCFCGLFGEPHCMCIRRIFVFGHSPDTNRSIPMTVTPTVP